MSNGKPVRASSLDRLCNGTKGVECVFLPDLRPSTTLLVQTVNSLYRVVIDRWPDVSVQGGAFFPQPASAQVTGATTGGSAVRNGCICVGLFVELCAGGRRITTSRVRAIIVVEAFEAGRPAAE